MAELPLLTTREAAERLGITPRRVTALIKSGRLPATKLGDIWVINPEDLELVGDRKVGNPNWIAAAKDKKKGGDNNK